MSARCSVFFRDNPMKEGGLPSAVARKGKHDHAVCRLSVRPGPNASAPSRQSERGRSGRLTERVIGVSEEVAVPGERSAHQKKRARRR